MVAMGLLAIGFDKYFTFILFGWMRGDIQIVADGIFAVVDDLAPDVVQRAVVEFESHFNQTVFQSFERVTAQVVGYPQGIGRIAIFNFAIRQA